MGHAIFCGVCAILRIPWKTSDVRTSMKGQQCKQGMWWTRFFCIVTMMIDYCCCCTLVQPHSFCEFDKKRQGFSETAAGGRFGYHVTATTRRWHTRVGFRRRGRSLSRSSCCCCCRQLDGSSYRCTRTTTCLSIGDSPRRCPTCRFWTVCRRSDNSGRRGKSTNAHFSKPGLRWSHYLKKIL